MPTNLYGPGDNFHTDDSHVIPALMCRMHDAKINHDEEISVWGTGNQMREFLHVDDLADACVYVMGLEKPELDKFVKPTMSHINVGTGVDVTIRELVETLCDVVGYEGGIRFDDTKPDGAPRKLLDVSRLKSLGWEARTDLRAGLAYTYEWFTENYSKLRR